MVGNGAESLAQIRILTGLTVVIPTYKEVKNISHIIGRLDKLRRDYSLDLEVLLMDDNSRDGSVELVDSLNLDWVKIIVRTAQRGLSPAVIDGFKLATKPVLVCMDCDLSHPPERIPSMILALESGQEFVLGSRYVPGGSTDDDWGMLRWLNSRIATLLARPLTSVRDPMSGFMALRRRDFEKAKDLNPIGYKIALELIVKCGFENVGEVPIKFVDRIYGESKLSFREQLKYIQHLRRLYIHKFGNAMHLAQFLVVGASGVFVNLVALTILSASGLSDEISLAGGIFASLGTNFILNRRFSFSYARGNNIWTQFLGFLMACTVGMLVNFGTALYVQEVMVQPGPFALQISALCGILAGTAFNFIGNRYVVFRKRFIKR